MLPAAAQAETLTFNVKSNHENVVSLEFYSQDRSVAWPGGGEVYVIDDYQIHTYSLSCQRGESICYGAWVRNSNSEYWGVGYNDTQGCESCCWVCDGGETAVINLNY
ncbi:MAG: hypothetical protein KKH72_01085 [Alphaproteobacteria bacterium]|nr:hypothetical protein [Alphaproteobacteria bacterium]